MKKGFLEEGAFHLGLVELLDFKGRAFQRGSNISRYEVNRTQGMQREGKKFGFGKNGWTERIKIS